MADLAAIRTGLNKCAAANCRCTAFTAMDIDEHNLLRIVLSLKGGGSEQWPALIQAMNDLVRRGFFAAGGAGRDQDEFQAWFPGWLYGKRIDAAHAALEQKIASGECSDAVSQSAFLANYLASAIKSAVADYYKRDRRTRALNGAEDFPSRPSRFDDPGFREQLQRLQMALADLPDNLRVPFRLKFYAVVGLAKEDMQYVAVQSGLTAEEIGRLIEAEFREHAGRKLPISSAFIGSLLGIAAADDGRNTTVDQRVARARDRLRKELCSDE